MSGSTNCTNTLDSIPSSLNRLKNPPSQLFFEGDVTLLNHPLVSIVGSRKMSTYTKSMVTRLSLALSSADVAVVSGGAYGVDAAAHEAAFPNTIAVVASSLDITYPKQNQKLLESIRKEALMLSEYAPITKPYKQNFVARNRVVVGLSNALVIAQADIGSGSMHSAAFALESKIPIYVFGHRYGESMGTDRLLKDNKATLIDDIDEFVSQFSTTKRELKSSDEVLEYFKTSPSYTEAVLKYSNKVFEYELEGKITVQNGTVLAL